MNSYNSITKTTHLKNGQKRWIDISQKDTQMANKHMKRYSASSVIEVQIKNHNEILLHTLRMAIIKKDNSEGKDVEKSDLLCSHSWKTATLKY